VTSKQFGWRPAEGTNRPVALRACACSDYSLALKQFIRRKRPWFFVLWYVLSIFLMFYNAACYRQASRLRLPTRQPKQNAAAVERLQRKCEFLRAAPATTSAPALHREPLVVPGRYDSDGGGGENLWDSKLSCPVSLQRHSGFSVTVDGQYR